MHTDDLRVERIAMNAHDDLQARVGELPGLLHGVLEEVGSMRHEQDADRRPRVEGRTGTEGAQGMTALSDTAHLPIEIARGHVVLGVEHEDSAGMQLTHHLDREIPRDDRPD